MRPLQQPRPTRNALSLLGAATVATGLLVGSVPAVTAAPQAPSISGPSTASRQQAANFTIGGLPPGAAVSVAVVSASGQEAHFSAVADASGTLSHRLVPTSAGSWKLKVLDAQGRVLTSTTVVVAN